MLVLFAGLLVVSVLVGSSLLLLAPLGLWGSPSAPVGFLWISLAFHIFDIISFIVGVLVDVFLWWVLLVAPLFGLLASLWALGASVLWVVAWVLGSCAWNSVGSSGLRGSGGPRPASWIGSWVPTVGSLFWGTPGTSGAGCCPPGEGPGSSPGWAPGWGTGPLGSLAIPEGPTEGSLAQPSPRPSQ